MSEKFEEFINNDAIVIFDTNVYLNLYEYSPEVADKFIEAIYFIEQHIYIPNTVRREFFRNHYKCSGRQKKKFKNVPVELKKLTNDLKVQLNKQLNILEKFKFPKIDELKKDSLGKVLEVEKSFDKYLEENDVYEVINNNFLEQDKVCELVNRVISADRLLEEPTLDDIYAICSEGKNRYYKKMPPGFEDGKNKDGIDKYNDLIIWKEVLKYCKDNSKNLIFVTDDVKKDWWKTEGDNKIFHPDLIKEFKDETKMNILPLNSQQLFEILGELYHISIPDTIQAVLQYNVKKYVSDLMEYSDLVCDIQSIVVDSGETYVNTESLSSYDGSYFEMNDEFNTAELADYSLEEYKDGIAIYNISLDISIDARSKIYWGRDDETKEIILSDNYNIHELKGQAVLELTREVDEEYTIENIDDLMNELNYLELKILDLQLEEVDYIDSSELCVQCHSRIGTVAFGSEGEVVCDECAVQDEYGFICPECGRKLPDSESAGNGFCIECTNESDYL